MNAMTAEAAAVPVRPQSRTDWTPWIILTPALLFFLVFYVVPLAIMLANSAQRWDTYTYQVLDFFTLHQYTRYLLDPYYIEVLVRTVRIAALTTLYSVIAAYPVAVYLTKAGPTERSILTLIIISPLMVSVVILCFGWMVVFAPAGLINWTLRSLGIVGAPLKLKFSEASVISGLVHVYFPFVVLSIYNSLQNIDPATIRAARILGAGPLRTFWSITLPLSIPGALAGSLIVFALSISSFVVPMFLGGAWVKVVAYHIWEQNMATIDWPFGAAIAVILLVVTAAIMLTYNRLMERRLFTGVFAR